MAYYEICEKLSQGWTSVKDETIWSMIAYDTASAQEKVSIDSNFLVNIILLLCCFFIQIKNQPKVGWIRKLRDTFSSM